MNRSTPMRALATLLVLLLAACASGGGTTGATPEAQVKQRAAERWKLLIDKQPDKAWDYLSAGAQSAKAREAYAQEMLARPVHWLAAEPLEAQCTESRCDLRIRVDYEVKMPGIGGVMSEAPSYLYERWILQDGRWVHVPKEFL